MAPVTHLFAYAFLLFGSVRTQAVVKTQLLSDVYSSDIDEAFNKSLPTAPSFTKVKWDLPPGYTFSEGTWTRALTEQTYERYCGSNVTIYNVTYPDCPDYWVVGYCSQGQLKLDTVLGQLGRIPSNLRAGMSDFLYNKGGNAEGAYGESVDLAGSGEIADFVQVAVRAVLQPNSFVQTTAWKNAVLNDTCVADSSAVGDLNRTSPDYQTAGIRAAQLVAYKNIVGTWPGNVDTSCMKTQLDLITSSFPSRWSKEGQCQNKTTPTIQKTYSAFQQNLDFLDASVDREPPYSNSTVKQWASGSYPQFCYDTARSQRSTSDTRVNCELSKLEVFNVTYDDCTTQPAWTICRCTDAQLSVDTMVQYFGRVPPGVRSDVVHVFVVDGSQPDGTIQSSGGSNNDRFLIRGSVSAAVFSHESFHSVDKSFSSSQTFKDAYAADYCVPDNYAKSAPAEDFAQLGVWTHYDTNGIPISDYLDKNTTCMANQLRVVKAYAGNLIDLKTSKCAARRPNDDDVTPLVGKNVKLVETKVLPPVAWEHEHIWG